MRLIIARAGYLQVRTWPWHALSARLLANASHRACLAHPALLRFLRRSALSAALVSLGLRSRALARPGVLDEDGASLTRRTQAIATRWHSRLQAFGLSALRLSRTHKTGPTDCYGPLALPLSCKLYITRPGGDPPAALAVGPFPQGAVGPRGSNPWPTLSYCACRSALTPKLHQVTNVGASRRAHGQANRRNEGRTDGQTDRRTDRRTNEHDTLSFPVLCTLVCACVRQYHISSVLS